MFEQLKAKFSNFSPREGHNSNGTAPLRECVGSIAVTYL